MDRPGWDQRTDIVIVASPTQREVIWIPRDLFCESLNNRINGAYRWQGHPVFQTALLEHGIKVDHSVCVLREVVEKAFANYEITVPVEKEEAFLYPLLPQKPIEEGSKIVKFSPPEERLCGERFHQWIGARMPLSGISTDATGDLVRIKRQQILLRRLLEEKFDFSSLDFEGINVSSPQALEELSQVRTHWSFRTLDNLEPVTIRKMYVFIRKGGARMASNEA